jgi:hypothetical protein
MLTRAPPFPSSRPVGADLNGIHALSEDGEIDLELDQFFYEKEYK